MCVKVMTSEVCGIDFVESADIDSIYHHSKWKYTTCIYRGTRGYIHREKTTKLFFCTGDLGFIYK